MTLLAVARLIVRPRNSRGIFVRTISHFGNKAVPISIKDIYVAHSRIKPYIQRTPIFTSSTFDRQYKRKFFFKGEHLQKTGSFKIRGALNAILSLLSCDKDLTGVVAHSSGNHGQALAWAAQRFNVKCHVVLPDYTPDVKVRSITEYGANISFYKGDPCVGNDVRQRIVDDFGYVAIPTSDDFDIITGQGTVGLELMEDVATLDAVLVTASRGGLTAGVALAAKALKPNMKVFVVEPEGKNLALCLQRGERDIENQPALVDTIAESLRATHLGPVTWPIILKYVEKDVLTVNNDDIIHGMRFAFERMKFVIEGAAGAVMAAAMSEQFIKMDASIRHVGVILCGGNVDIDKLPWIANSAKKNPD